MTPDLLHPSHLQKKSALITGASSGIGEACAWALAQHEMKLKLVARRVDRLQSLRRELETAHPKCHVEVFGGDVRDGAFIEELENKNAFGVDVLINNAGLARGKDSVATARVADWQEMIDTNITAAFAIAQRVVKFMSSHSGGHIVNIGSIAGHTTYAGGSVYCATKHALTAFTKTLREETCGQNIRVSLISPGMVETEFSIVRLQDAQLANEVYAGMQPLTAHNVALVILYCLTAPPHVNIDEIVVTPLAQGAATKVHRENQSHTGFGVSK